MNTLRLTESTPLNKCVLLTVLFQQRCRHEAVYSWLFYQKICGRACWRWGRWGRTHENLRGTARVHSAPLSRFSLDCLPPLILLSNALSFKPVLSCKRETSIVYKTFNSNRVESRAATCTASNAHFDHFFSDDHESIDCVIKTSRRFAIRSNQKCSRLLSTVSSSGKCACCFWAIIIHRRCIVHASTVRWLLCEYAIPVMKVTCVAAWSWHTVSIHIGQAVAYLFSVGIQSVFNKKEKKETKYCSLQCSMCFHNNIKLRGGIMTLTF